MLVKTFENNGNNISKNSVKLNLKQNTNLYCITLKQFTVNGHN